MIQRDLEKRLIAHLTHRVEHPNVALLEGARQVGKTTLVESIRPKLGGNSSTNAKSAARAQNDNTFRPNAISTIRAWQMTCG